MHLVNTFEEEFVEDTWCKLSKKVASDTSRSVVSLASFKEDQRFFVCTGVFIDCIESTSRILTSASLIRSSPDENNIADNLKIQVYLPNKLVVTGTLQHYNLEYNVAVISVMGFRCLRTAEFHNQVQIEPQREVVAVGRVFESGKLMATSGIVTGKEGKLDCKELMVTTCKIAKAGIGGPLIDLDGNFLGMNFYGMKETYFLPRIIILGLMKHFEAERSVTDEVIYSKANRWPVPVPRWSYPSSRARRPQKFFMRKDVKDLNAQDSRASTT
jgi:S1-C subfamily serine protease